MLMVFLPLLLLGGQVWVAFKVHEKEMWVDRGGGWAWKQEGVEGRSRLRQYWERWLK